MLQRNGRGEETLVVVVIDGCGRHAPLMDTTLPTARSIKSLDAFTLDSLNFSSGGCM
jgi:hypothetical protein